MTDALATTSTTPDAQAIERVLVSGDLAALTPAQRVSYYNAVCKSLGLNPLTKPFEYISLNNKLTLYAKRDATDQLRQIHKVSITRLVPAVIDDLCVVTVDGANVEGRIDSATGAVSIAGLKGEAKANAMMKAETKAKRRLTLSLCGLGMTDESEVESIAAARPITVNHATGEIVETTANGSDLIGAPAPTGDNGHISEAQRKRLFAIAKAVGWNTDELKSWLNERFSVTSTSEIPREKYDEIIAAVQGGTDPF